MVTKTKASKKTTATATHTLEQASLIPAMKEIERQADFLIAEMKFDALLLKEDARVTFVIQTQGKRACFGSYTPSVWTDKDGKKSCEIQISAEHLTRPAIQTTATIAHELQHKMNNLKGIRDTSNNGVYHNGKWLDSAKDMLILAEKTKKNGHGITVGFTPIWEAVILAELQPDESAFTLVRDIVEAKKKNKAPTKMLKWTCDCGVNVRCAVELRATCDECGTVFAKDKWAPIPELMR
jgi:hypothetical protein